MANYTKYIALDFGTSGCAISLGFSEPDPNNIMVYSAWNESRVGLSFKCPSILLVNPSKTFEKFGEEAFKAYNKLSKDDVKRYYYFYRFKMNLYRSPVSSLPLVDCCTCVCCIIKTHGSESRGQEEAGTRRTSELFTGSTTVKLVNALNKPP